MKEIGIDISGHKSKPISSIPLTEVDTIITLCAEEVCPVVPGNVRRLHWALADPAAANGSQEDRLATFGETRDELRGRIVAFLTDENVITKSS